MAFYISKKNEKIKKVKNLKIFLFGAHHNFNKLKEINESLDLNTFIVTTSNQVSQNKLNRKSKYF